MLVSAQVDLNLWRDHTASRQEFLGKCCLEGSWGQIFLEASEIFLRLLKGETISSDKMRKTILTRSNFRSDEDWLTVQEAYLAHNEEENVDSITIKSL